MIPNEIHADYIRLCRLAQKAQRRGDAAGALHWYKVAHQRLRMAETRQRIGFTDKRNTARGRNHHVFDTLNGLGKSGKT